MNNYRHHEEDPSTMELTVNELSVYRLSYICLTTTEYHGGGRGGMDN